MRFINPLLVLCLCFAIHCPAQSHASTAPSKAASSTKRFCQKDGGFCASYPAAWLQLGEAFGNGIIVAPQQKAERMQWDEVTLAMVVPAANGSEASPSIDQLIDTAMKNLRDAGHKPETLQRQERLVGGLPAESIRIRYFDAETRGNWEEEIVFVEGPEQEVYSLALKARPENMAKLEPAFARIVRSWKLQAAQTAEPSSTGATSSGLGAVGSTPHN